MTAANREAFLRVIREGESNQRDDAYTLLNGGTHFAGFEDHPYAGQPAPPGLAAGAYQFIPHTWQRVAKVTGATNFSPPEQDRGAIALIEMCGAMPAVDRGDLDEACRLLADTWIALPSLGKRRAESIFTRYGGTLAGAAIPAPPPPVQGPTMPLLISLLPLILALFAPKAQQALTKVSDNPAGAEQLIQMLIGKGAELVGVPPTQPVQVVAALQKAQAEVSSPGAMAPVVQELQEAALDWIEKIVPLIDKIAAYDRQAWNAEEASRKAAAERSMQMSEGPLFRNPTFLLAICIMTLVTFVVVIVLLKDVFAEGKGFSTDMQAFVIGAVVGSALTAIIQFFFGSSRSSGAKDVLISEMASRRPQA